MASFWKRASVTGLIALACVVFLPIMLWLAFALFWNESVMDAGVRARTEDRRARSATLLEKKHRAKGSTSPKDSSPPRSAMRDPTTPGPIERLSRVGTSDRMFVAELSALRHSELGQRLVSCVTPNLSRALKVSETAGVDFLEMFDRFAVIELPDDHEVVVLTGHFSWAASLRVVTGDAFFFEPGEDGRAWALWRNEALLFAPNQAALERALEQLRAPPTSDASTTPDLFGEIYVQGPAGKLLRADFLNPSGALDSADLDAYAEEVRSSQAAVQASLMSDFYAEVTAPTPPGARPKPIHDHQYEAHPFSNDVAAQMTFSWDDDGLRYQMAMDEADLLRLGDDICGSLREELKGSWGDSPVIRFLLGGVERTDTGPSP